MIAAARARHEKIIAFPQRSAVFEVFPGAASDQAHLITAVGPAEALERFLEGWHPAVEAGEGLEVTVVDRATGVQARFVIELD